METINNVMTIVGWVTGIIGAPAGIFFIIKMIYPKKNLTWKKIKIGIKHLSSKVNVIDPDYIITFSGRGDILASLLLAELDNKYPLYTCLLRRNYNRTYLKPINWSSFTTRKWQVFVPDEVDKLLEHRALIVDDLTISGETIEMLIAYLVSKGMKQENIETMTLLADENVYANKNIPTNSWLRVKVSEYAVPWGKTKQ